MTNNKFNFLLDLRLLLNVEGIGPGKIFSLLSKLDSFENILSSSINNLLNVPGISKNLASRIQMVNKQRAELAASFETEIAELEKLTGSIITYWDDNYPKLLRRIYYPPLMIQTLGEFTEKDQFAIAVVGTRMPTAYGKMQAEKISSALAEQNITIVSGLARGIDSIAHKAALKVNGRTISVIGSGLDVIYPPENKKLFHQIAEQGLIISEFPLGTKPDAQNFPKRNRIIAGISLGTVVVETKHTGGAMQTAAHALDQNREVFAVPGNLGVAQSEGTNSLIQKGEAKLIKSHEDILVELELKLKPIIGKNIPKPSVELSLFEQKVLETISDSPLHIDNIASSVSMNTSECLVHLLSLEFKGMVRQLPGKMFLASV
ncbi:MAG: DNA-protecting protein DprA [Ignavibacteriae bacterium]|nr:DNA-protecting protein DprA [Ignavibacteriota bacterium]NOG97312.1 DNA-protecting protein DprA [Ignavibacteriota bacterium]